MVYFVTLKVKIKDLDNHTRKSNKFYTCSEPILNLNGLPLSLDESNLAPSGRYPCRNERKVRVRVR